MRILDDTRDAPVERVWLYLTPDEAKAMVGALQDRLNDPDPDPEWHAHVEASDGGEVEVTIALYNANDLPSDPKIAAFLRDGTW